MAVLMNTDINVKINILGLVLGIIVIFSDSISVVAQHRRSRGRWEDGSIRLVGGRSDNEGTVLIYHWSRWGAICDDYWDKKDAEVVCNQLGFPGASAAPTASKFGKGRRRVWLSGLHCRGHERHVTMCYSRGWGNVLSRCRRNYWTSAGVICNPKTTTTRRRTTTTTTALTTTTTTTPTTTTTTRPTTTTTRPTTTTKTTTAVTKPYAAVANHLIEETADAYQLDKDLREYLADSIQLQNMTTTTSTLRPTTTSRSRTRKPTTTTSTTTSEKPPTTTTTRKPPTTTTTTTQKPTTTTTTTTKRPTTTNRPTTKKPRTTKKTTPKVVTTPRPVTSSTTPPRAYNKWIYNKDLWRYFMYFRDGTHVTSRPDPRYYRLHPRESSSTSSSTTTSTTTTTTTTRPPAVDNSIYNVIGGADQHAVINDFQRGNNIDTSDNLNHLLSRSDEHQDNDIQRHEPSHHHHNYVKEGYQGDAPYTGEHVQMSDTEEVEVRPVKEESTPSPTAPSYTEFRLAGGRLYSGFNEGRLEVRLAGSNVWGVICGDDWDFRAAIVTCKHLGVGYARTEQKTDHYGGSDLDKVLANIRCTGKEERLEDCTVEKTKRTPGHEVCSSAKSVAGVICDTRLPDLTPNATRLEQSAYLQDRYLYYLQCAFEENCLSTSAEALYGTNSWTTLTRRLLRFSTIAHNVGTADFRPEIDRSKWEWHACHQHYHSMESFSHYDILDKHGNRVAEGHKASFCLEDSECNRGTMPKYNCQNWGQQGISMGCADAYLADIDCQWIDVTDVRPGMYVLKVELNPNMYVPEISYDNNVVVCDLYFNTQSVRLYNCKHESLL